MALHLYPDFPQGAPDGSCIGLPILGASVTFGVSTVVSEGRLSKSRHTQESCPLLEVLKSFGLRVF